MLAGHETTANQLAWTFERLVRTPDAWARLREEPEAAPTSTPTIYESPARRGRSSRSIGRRVTVPWRFGDVGGRRAGTACLMSILLLHHREDLYPDPFAFRPERFEGTKPGTYTWIPFGGGIRRCLGRDARDGRDAHRARDDRPALRAAGRPTRRPSGPSTATSR